LRCEKLQSVVYGLIFFFFFRISGTTDFCPTIFLYFLLFFLFTLTFYAFHTHFFFVAMDTATTIPTAAATAGGAMLENAWGTLEPFSEMILVSNAAESFAAAASKEASFLPESFREYEVHCAAFAEFLAKAGLVANGGSIDRSQIIEHRCVLASILSYCCTETADSGSETQKPRDNEHRNSSTCVLFTNLPNPLLFVFGHC
jgi:hypothetical protein